MPMDAIPAAQAPTYPADVRVPAWLRIRGNKTVGIDGHVGNLLYVPPISTPVVALIGNSITARNSNYPNGVAPTGNFLYGGSGYMVWANILSGQRCKLPKTHILGYPGKTVGEVYKLGILSLQQLVPSPAVVVVGDATNNLVRTDGQQTFDAIVNGVTINGVYFPGLVDFIARVREMGARAILMPINPRQDAVLTPSQVGVAMRVNRWLLEVARNVHGVAVPDYLRAIVDPGSTLYGGKTAWSSDLLHPNINGGYWMGKGVASILMGWFAPIDRLPLNNAVAVKDAPHLPRVQNPMMIGTSGAVANGVTGAVPSGWTLGKVQSGDASLSVVGSIVNGATDPNFGYLQQTLSGGFTNGPGDLANATFHGSRLYASVATSDLVAGDVIDAYCAVEMDAGAVNLSAPSLILRAADNSLYNHSTYPGDGGSLPGEAWAGVLYSGELRLPTNAYPMQLHMAQFLNQTSSGTVSVAGTVRFGRPTVYKQPVE